MHIAHACRMKKGFISSFFLLRNKYGSNFTYKLGRSSNVPWKQTECFAFITQAEQIDSTRVHAIQHERDFDVLEEGLGLCNRIFISNEKSFHIPIAFLGEIIGGYLLLSYPRRYIPDRIVDKIDKLSATMVESGLFQFYISSKIFQEKKDQAAHVLERF